MHLGLWKWVWRISMKNCVEGFQNVRGLADDLVTKLDKNEDLALEMRDLTELYLARNFMRSKGDFQRRQHRSSRLRSRLAWRISGLIHGVWGLWTTVLVSIADWGMDVENGFEGEVKLICGVGSIGSWLCVEWGSEDIAFEIANINGVERAVLDGCSFGCRTDVWEEFESERFVIRLVGFVMRKVCDNGRAESCDEKIKGGAIKKMILWVLLQFAPLHRWFSFLVVPDLLCKLACVLGRWAVFRITCNCWCTTGHFRCRWRLKCR